jgi:hypothetical protein
MKAIHKILIASSSLLMLLGAAYKLKAQSGTQNNTSNPHRTTQGNMQNQNMNNSTADSTMNPNRQAKTTRDSTSNPVKKREPSTRADSTRKANDRGIKMTPDSTKN